MTKKTPAFLLFTICVSFVFSQKDYVIKKTLDKSDSSFLMDRLSYYIFDTPSMQMQYKSEDFRRNGFTIVKPFDTMLVEESKKKLKGDYNDIEIYYGIANMYNDAFKYTEGTRYLNKAFDLAWKNMKENPDSASAYTRVALIYFLGQDMKSSLAAAKKAYELNPKNKTNRDLLLIEQLASGKTKEAKEIIDIEIKDQPDSAKSYDFLPFYYLYQMMMMDSITNSAKKLALLKDKPVDEILDISQMKNAHEKHKGDFLMELYYHMSEFCVLFGKVDLMAKMDTSKTRGRFEFPMDKEDKKLLSKTEKFLRSNIENKKMPNKYLPYKTLAYISLIKNDTKQGKEYFKKAVEFKKQGTDHFVYNASMDYDDLAALAIGLKDTAGYGKLMEEKLTALPGINPSPYDYIWVARYAFYKKDFGRAKQLALKAIELNEKGLNANMIAGASALAMGDKQDAVKHLNAENKLNKESVEMWMVAGIYSLLNNDADIAHSCFEEAKIRSAVPEEIQGKYLDKYLEEVKK